MKLNDTFLVPSQVLSRTNNIASFRAGKYKISFPDQHLQKKSFPEVSPQELVSYSRRIQAGLIRIPEHVKQEQEALIVALIALS